MSTGSSSSEANSSFSSSSGCSNDSRSYPLVLLEKVDLLKELMADVPEAPPEPSPSAHPVVRICYTDTFKYVMNLFRCIATRHVEPTAIPSFQSRWLLLLSFTIKQCSAHYSAWKHRRGVVLSPANMVECARERLRLPPVWNSDAPLLGVQTRCYEDLQGDLKAVADTWLPSETDLLPPSHSASSNDSSRLQPVLPTVWQCVSWELRCIVPFNLTHHKNFQVWHHRRELLTEALGSVPEDQRTSITSSRMRWDEFQAQQLPHATPSIVDAELELCTKTLLQDAKNYHVWSHRAWILWMFPFLVEGPPAAMLRSHVAAWEGIHGHIFQGSGPSSSSAAPVAAPTWYSVMAWLDDKKCLEPYIPECPLSAELAYTSQGIRDDCLNNSVWCHRFHLVRKSLLSPQFFTAMSSPTVRDGINSTLNDFRWLCMQEILFSLQWAMVEPCNESPLVHARGIADLFFTAAVLARLNATCGADSGPQTLNAGHLFNSMGGELQLLPSILAQHYTSTLPGTRNSGDGTATCCAPESLMAALASVYRRLTCEDIAECYAMHEMLESIIEEHILPTVEDIRAQLSHAAELACRYRHVQVSGEAGSATGPECNSGASGGPTALSEAEMQFFVGLCSTRTQFLNDNTHQAYSALFQSRLGWLKLLWVSVLDEQERQCMSRDFSVDETIKLFARHADGEPLVNPMEVPSGGAEASGRVQMFRIKELKALDVVKRLYAEDTIRSKYWELMASTVLHRDYDAV